MGEFAGEPGVLAGIDVPVLRDVAVQADDGDQGLVNVQ